MRMRSPSISASVLAALAVAPLAFAQSIPTTPGHMPPPGDLSFVTNAGQWGAGIAARARTGNGTAWFHDRGVVFTIQKQEMRTSGRGPLQGPPRPHTVDETKLGLRFVGARATEPTALGAHGTRTFVHGSHEPWNASTHDSLRYEQLYPGIDAAFRTDGQQLVYDFHLAPHSSHTTIEIACDGAASLALRDDGSLVMRTGIGDVVQSAPQSFELLADGTKIPVPSRFVLRGPDRYGFDVERDDPSRPLWIDPGVDWTTYFGTSGVDYFFGAAQILDEYHVFLGGSDSPSIPAPWSSNTQGPAGTFDVVVSLMIPTDPAATAPVITTVIGGSGFDHALDVAFDPTTQLITIVGVTWSSDFPVTPDANQPTTGGGIDGFLTQVDVAGQIVYSTYFGGNGDDRLTDVVMQNGVATIAGYTDDPTLPVSPSAYQPTLAGGLDLVIGRLDPGLAPGSQLTASTFLGSSADEGVVIEDTDDFFLNWDLAELDVADNGDVTVSVFSQGAGFPTSNFSFAGATDFLIARLDATLGQLLYSTYLGGPGVEISAAMTVDDNGAITVAGISQTPGAPVTAGAIQANHAGSNDGYLARIDPSLSQAQQLVYGTYVGDTGDDELIGMALEPDSTHVVVTGWSENGSLPTTPDAFQTDSAGPNASYVIRLDADASSQHPVHYFSYLSAPGSTGFGTRMFNGTRLDDGRWVLYGAVETAFPVGANGPQASPAGALDGAVLVMDLLPTGVERFGSGTAACDRPILAGVRFSPRFDNEAFAIYTTGAPPATNGVVLFGDPLPTPLAAFNIDLLLWNIATAEPVTTDGLGFSMLPLPIGVSSLPGVSLSAQSVFLTNATCPGSGPFAASDRLDLTITAGPPPLIGAITPPSAPSGTTITIAGSNFSAAATITVAGVPTTPSLLTENSIQFPYPPGLPCDSAVVVTNPDGASSTGTLNPTPNVTNAISPQGPAAGGALFTMVGSGFSPNTTVTIGGAPATVILSVSGLLRVTTPPGTPGPAEVLITTDGGCSTTTTYTYL